MCIPKFKMYNYEMNSFAKELCSDIRYVRSSNILGNLDTYVLITSKDGYRGYKLIEKGKNIKEVYLSEGIYIIPDSKDKRIWFRNDGSPNPSGITIKVYNEKTTKEITIVPVSGRVLFKEGQYE
ncbi:MAG: hypothetical protein ACRCXA_04675 [Peptostreptococcaceae bacterium]